MSYGADKWKAGDSFAGSLRSAQTMRFYGLSKMLEAAELAARLGSKAEAVEHLRRLPFPASGPVKKDDPNVDIETYSFLTTTPNPLVATINHERMPVLLTREEEFETWLSGSPDDALGVAHEYEPDQMRIMQGDSTASQLPPATLL